METESDNISVVVRIRPLNEREKRDYAHSCVIIDKQNQNSLIIDSKTEPKKYVFDYVAGENTPQEQIFNIIGKSFTAKCLNGYNSCIFAYGQTGAGKTYTMQGKGIEKDLPDCQDRGLQPRIFDYIFTCIRKELSDDDSNKCLVRCSYFEIYNEQIIDLLSNTKGNLQIREDLKKGVYVEGLVEEQTYSADETLELLRRGVRNRHVGATQMNIESSRSHTVFSMSLEVAKNENGILRTKSSKLHFVDLAGSERQKYTATVGERLKEATNINKSLSVLGCVINSLVEISEGKSRHVRYRDSKLTFILKDSLGGNSKTLIIANISAASTQFSETLSTLKFAQRAKMIKNRALINEESSGNIDSLKKEIKRLRDELDQTQGLIKSLQLNKKSMYKLTPNKLIYTEKGENNNKNNNFIIEQHQKHLIEQTKHNSEIEDFIQQNVNSILDNLSKFNQELNKKDQCIQTFKSTCDFYEESEIQYRTIINIQQERINRFQTRIQQGIPSHLHLDQFLLEDYTNTLNQLDQYKNLVNSNPFIMRLARENVELKEKLNDEYFFNENSKDTFNDNLILIKNLSSIIENNIIERQIFEEKLERMGLINISTPDKLKREENSINQVKMQFNQKIEKLNQEIIEQKQKIIQLERSLENEKQKNKEILVEKANIKNQKIKNEIFSEERVQNVIRNLQQMQKQYENEDDIDSIITQLNIKLIETNEKLHYSRLIGDQLKIKLNETQNALKREISEKELVMNKFHQKYDKLTKEKALLENELNTNQNNMQCILDELNLTKQENTQMNQKLIEMYNDLELSKQNLEQQVLEKMELQEQIQSLNESQNHNKIIRDLQNQIDTVNNKNENLEMEKSKLQLELETLLETFEYKMNEIEETKKFYSILIQNARNNGEFNCDYGQYDYQSNNNDDMYLEPLKKPKREYIEDSTLDFVNQLRGDLSQKSDECIQLKRKIEGMSVELQELVKQLEHMRINTKEHNEKQQQQAEQIKYMEDQRDQMSKKQSEQRERIVQLQDQIRVNLDQIQELVLENRGYKENMGNIVKQIIVSNSQYICIDNNKINLDSSNGNNIVESVNVLIKQYIVNQYENAITELKLIIQNKNLLIQQLQQDISSNQQNLNLIIAEKETKIQAFYQNELQTMDHMIQSLTHQLNSTSTQQNSFSNQIQTYSEHEKNNIKKEIEATLNQQKKQEFQKITEQYEHICNELQNNIISNYEQKIKLIHQQNQNEINVLSTAKDELLASIKNSYETQISQMQKQFSDNIQTITQQYNNEFNLFKTTHEHIQHTVQTQYLQELSNHIQENDKCKLQLNNTLKLLEQNQQNTESLQNKLNIAQKELAEKDQLIIQKNIKLEQLQNYSEKSHFIFNVETQLQVLQDENRNLKEELSQKIILQDELQTQIEELVKNQEELFQNHYTQFKELENKHKNIMEVLQIKEKEYLNLKDENSLLVSEKEKISNQLKKHIQDNTIIIKEEIIEAQFNEQEMQAQAKQNENLQQMLQSLSELAIVIKYSKAQEQKMTDITKEYLINQLSKKCLENKQFIFILAQMQIILDEALRTDITKSNDKILETYQNKLYELLHEESDQSLSQIMNTIKGLREYIKIIQEKKLNDQDKKAKFEQNVVRLGLLERQILILKEKLRISYYNGADENYVKIETPKTVETKSREPLSSILDENQKTAKRKAQIQIEQDELKKKIKIEN